MNQYKIYDEIPPGWQAACEKHNAFFHSPVWLDLLKKAFNMDTLFVWDEISENGIVINIFKVYIFKIGYVSFPQVAYINGNNLDEDMINELVKLGIGKKVNILRFTGKDVEMEQDDHCTINELPNTFIPNLQEWDIKKLSSSVRYSVNRSNRTGFQVVESYDSSKSQNIFELYADVIRKNKGNIRFSKKYFKELLEYGQNNENIKCYFSILENNFIGFIIVIIHNNCAYYLHGACYDNYRKDCPFYGLMNEAINWAKENGLERFDMMISPPDQLSLVTFKEKWGGTTYTTRSYTIYLNKQIGKLFSIAQKLYDMFS